MEKKQPWKYQGIPAEPHKPNLSEETKERKKEYKKELNKIEIYMIHIYPIKKCKWSKYIKSWNHLNKIGEVRKEEEI